MLYVGTVTILEFVCWQTYRTLCAPPPPSPTPTISIIQIFSSCFMYIIFTVLCSIYRLIPCSLSLLVRPCLCGALCVLVCPLVRSTHIRGGHFQTYIDSLDILLAVHLRIIYFSLFPTWYTVFPSTYTDNFNYSNIFILFYVYYIYCTLFDI